MTSTDTPEGRRRAPRARRQPVVPVPPGAEASTPAAGAQRGDDSTPPTGGDAIASPETGAGPPADPTCGGAGTLPGTSAGTPPGTSAGTLPGTSTPPGTGTGHRCGADHGASADPDEDDDWNADATLARLRAMRATAAARARADRSRRRGRRVAVVLGLVGLVGVGFVVRDALPHRPTGPRATEASTVAADVNALARTLAGDEQSLGRCPLLASPAGLSCAAGQDRRMGQALLDFGRRVGAASVPSDARPMAARLVRDTDRLAGDLDALAETTSAATYQALAAQRDIGPLGRLVDQDAQALVSRIRS